MSNPDGFSFIPQMDAGLNQRVVSGAITVTGISSSVEISIVGGEYSLDGGTTFTTEAGAVEAGAEVVVRIISSQATSETTHATLDIGGVKGTFSVTTSSVEDGIDFSIFKDPALKQCVIRTGITQISKLLDLSCKSMGVIDSSGIEQLTALTSLDLSKNQLTSIDVSANVALIKLLLYSNKLGSINVSSNRALKELTLVFNELATIDVSSNMALTILELSGNNLTTIDVSENVDLTWLGLAYNEIKTIDVSTNTVLTYLALESNSLASIDVSSNGVLDSLLLDDNKLTEIDVSSNSELTILSLYKNKLTTIDVSGNTALVELDLQINELTEIDVSTNKVLTTLDLDGNDLVAIDVSGNAALTELYLYYNRLTEIDVSSNASLTSLKLGGNKLSTIDVSGNTALTTLDVSGNKLTEIDVSNNAFVSNLYLKDNLIPCSEIQDIVAKFETVDSSDCINDIGSPVVPTPNDFKIDVPSVGTESATVRWTSLTIDGDGGVFADIYINGNKAATGLTSSGYLFASLAQDSEYQVSIIARSSAYGTTLEKETTFRTEALPSTFEVSSATVYRRTTGTFNIPPTVVIRFSNRDFLDSISINGAIYPNYTYAGDNGIMFSISDDEFSELNSASVKEGSATYTQGEVTASVTFSYAVE